MRVKQFFSLCLLFILSSAFLFCLVMGSNSIVLSSQPSTAIGSNQGTEIAKKSSSDTFSVIKKKTPGDSTSSAATTGDTTVSSTGTTSATPTTKTTVTGMTSDAGTTTDVVHPETATEAASKDPATTTTLTADTTTSSQPATGTAPIAPPASTTATSPTLDTTTGSSEATATSPTVTPTASAATTEETPSGITPEQLSLSSQIKGPITEDKKLCLTLPQKVKGFTIKMEGETNRNLAIFEPQEKTYCANLLIADFPDGSYKLTVEIKQDVQLKEVSVFNTLPVEVNRGVSQVDTDQKLSELENRCSQSGADSSEECKNFYLDKYAEKVSCLGLSSTACGTSIKENYIKAVVETAKEYESINSQKADIFYKTMTVGKLENLVNQSNGEKILNLSIPLKEKETQIKVSQSYENITLRDTGLTQAAPIVVMIDSDGDGVPDDIEKRLGTKPNDKDTDGDGYKDGEEIQHGYNPLGDGKKEMGLSPVERAIILDQALEHPTTSGEEDPGLTVADAKAEYDEDGKESGYVFSGKAAANTVVTLYVYSDIPIVATIITDEYGNWKYDFTTLLSDGEHEIYAVINDETGKIIKKSSPLSFLIQEAQAATETEPTNTQPAPEATSNSIDYYLFAAVGLALLGITIFLVTIVKSKMDKPKAPKDSNTTGKSK